MTLLPVNTIFRAPVVEAAGKKKKPDQGVSKPKAQQVKKKNQPNKVVINKNNKKKKTRVVNPNLAKIEKLHSWEANKRIQEAGKNFKEKFNLHAPWKYSRGFIKMFRTDRFETYYRVYSDNKAHGGWLVKAAPKGREHAKEFLNLHPKYNTATHIQRVDVPRGILMERSRTLGGDQSFGKKKGGFEQFRIMPGQDKLGIVFHKGQPLKESKIFRKGKSLQ